jgi:hypothetical protein
VHKESAAAAKVWTGINFKDVSKAYEPLKRHNKRATKYRSKLEK